MLVELASGVKKRNGDLKVIKYNNIEIDLFSRGIPDKVMISLSGGLDSASLLYIICKEFPQIEVIPYTGKDKYAPFDFLSATMIIQWMREKFPDNNIKEHEWFEFDVQDPVQRKRAEDEWENEKVLVGDKWVERCSTISGLAKILMIREFTHSVWDKHGNPMIVTGMTGNPSVEEMKKHGFYDVREKRRDDGKVAKEYGFNYQPFINVDKKFVADIYRSNDIMDLYELTSSCVGSAENTNFHTEPCGVCFWCHEKKWAFEC